MEYIAFDVETPNHLNNKICSIGITTIDEDGSLQSKNYLINPECEFDKVNISITGIYPEMVSSAATFPQVWEEIAPLFRERIVVAHNALFDLNVLHKTLEDYQLTMPAVNYICTMKLAQEVLPQVDNYKLPTLCSYYSIPLRHHDSGSDSKACASLLLKLLPLGISIQHAIKSFDPYATNTEHEHTNKYHTVLSETTQALNEMNLILQAISCDGILTENELSTLIRWMNANISLKGNFPYDRIYNKLSEVVQDGIITPEEHADLINLFQAVCNPVEAIKRPCECIELSGKNICLSGDFDHGSKEFVSSLLEEKGATMQKSITKKTNILVVGGQGSSAWSSGTYGTKIKKALELQSKGIEIQIIREAEFFGAIGV